MSKIVKIGSLVFLGAAVGYGLNYGWSYANIASSYAAKNMCSGVFVSHRTESDVMSDLYAVSFANLDVDYDKKLVGASIYGLAHAEAVYRPGLGCTLLNGSNVEELHKFTPAAVDSAYQFEWPVVSPSTHFDSVLLARAITQAFEDTTAAQLKRTRAALVVYDGQIVMEKYAYGFTKETPLLGWSMTKSVTNAMVGLLVKDGKLSTGRGAPITEWAEDDRKKITLDNLLRMNSGLEFNEDYASPSDATKMLFTEKSTGLYALRSKLAHKPGTVWSYSSGTTNILQEIIKRQFSTLEDYLAFPHDRLFRKLGMSSAVLETDPSGTYVGSSFMYATARDWAKFGQLYLQDGEWNEEQILPKGWAAYSASETKPSNGTYGAQFWIDTHDKELPSDTFFADGFEGQFVTIIPSEKLVVVRLGCSINIGFDNNSYVKSVLAALK